MRNDETGRERTAASLRDVGSDGADLPIFSLEVTTGDDACTTVSVAGELDLATADDFTRAVRGGLAAGAVVIDLREVTFMDSSGVRALNTALRESAENGRQLRVSEGMHPSVVQVLEMTGMLGLLPMTSAR
jgi:anti-anti-sigma factor